VGRSRSRSRLIPSRTSTRCTPDALTVTPWERSSAAIRAGPSLRSRRSRSMRPWTSGGTWPGLCAGRLERSTSPACPYARQRRCHLDRHWRDTPASAATWARGRPASTRRHRRRRPSTVSGALAVGHEDLPAVGVVAFSSSTPRPEVLPTSRSSSSCPARYQPPWVGQLAADEHHTPTPS
jgi:hypothetical protein